MAEQNGWPFPLLSYVQGDSISSDVVLPEKGVVHGSRTFSLSHLTQQQVCTNGGSARKEHTPRNK